MVQIKFTGDESKKPNTKVGYTFPFDGFVDVTKELKNSSVDEKRLSVVARLLDKQRAFALDHERGGEQYHGAALIHTKRGRWYLCANIHVHRTKTSRNCAEANGIIEARQREGARLEVSEVYVSGGKANYDEGQKFLHNEGTHCMPCGSCRDVIYDNRLKIDGDTLIHSVPLGDGKQKLIAGNPDDPRAEHEYGPNDIITRRISDLLPHVTKVLEDRNGSMRKTMQGGYDWLKNTSTRRAVTKAMLRQDVERIESLDQEHASQEEILRAVNTAMMDAAHQYYKDASVKPNALSIAVVRSADRQYHLAKYADNGDVLSTTNAIAEGIGRMVDDSLDHKATDVFYVEFTEKQLAALSTDAPLELTMPDGATREIIKKAGPKNGKGDTTITLIGDPVSARGVMVHAFVPNNPAKTKFNPKTMVHSFGIRELLPFAYANPKSDRGR